MYSSPQINLYSADVARGVAFYERLGFAETFRTPAVGTPIHVELVCLWTDDADAAYADLLAHGAAPMSEPHDWLETLRAAWVADPDGNPVELVERRR